MHSLLWIATFVSLQTIQALDRGTHWISECRSVDGIGQKCVWAHAFERSACPGGNCTDLVIFFSGSDMGCQNTLGSKKISLGKVLTHYAKAGFVAVVACLYESWEKEPMPLLSQGRRIDLLFKSIRANPHIRKHWTGENLLLAGVSLGASSPVVLMARSELDNSEEWRGTRMTGACFHDGVYDIEYLDRFFWQNYPSCRKMRRETLCQRYGDFDCRFPMEKTAATEADSISRVSPTEFAISQWKLIQCGSQLNLPKCAILGDRIPKEPIETLCQQLNRSPNHQCEFGELADLSHVECAFTTSGVNECLDWFRKKTTVPR